MSRAVGQALWVPRGGIVLLLGALLLVVLPHLPRLPIGVLLLVAVCVGWQVQVYRSRWRLPGNLVKVLLVGLGIATVGLEMGTLLGLEAAVALLVVAVVLKLVEMRAKRDAYLVVLLAYFVLATCFLFAQTIPVTVYVLCAAVVVTAALVSLNQGTAAAAPLPALRTAGVLLAQALPLAIVLFVFFPRVAPLWSVPLPTSARTGMSGEITPGDIANLSQSDELAFRASFTGSVPRAAELYWRGVVFSHYEEGTWSQFSRTRGGPRPGSLVYWSGARLPHWLETLEPRGRPLEYAIVLEPTDRPWLFSLELPDAPPEGAGLVRDFRLVARRPVNSRMHYRLRSWPGWQLDTELPDWLRTVNTALPEGDNPRTLALAERLRAQSSSDRDYVATALDLFRAWPFHYTLKPPTLPRVDAMDAFLLESQRGFCAHFAGSFVYLMRAAGLPARMIGGYQGGEVNADGGYVSVHQYDAHAWAEVWLPGDGWLRVDPTAVVAPDRVEHGLAAALAEREELLDLSPFSGMRLRGMTLLGELLQAVDGLEHRWNLFVVGYDATAQVNALRGLLGEVTPGRLGMALLVGLGGLLLLLAPLVLRRPPHRPRSAEVRLAMGLGSALARAGLPAAPGESPTAQLRRAALAFPDLAEDLDACADGLATLLYDPHVPAAVAEDLRQRSRRLRLRLQFSVFRRLQPAQPDPHS